MSGRVTRYVHRLAGRYPLPRITQVVLATTPESWWFHVHARGVRLEGWEIPAHLGPDILEQLLPATERREDLL